MGLRAKRTVLEMASQHFKEFGLPLTIDHKDYVVAVGSKIAISAISVKRSFKKWSVLLHALRKHYPELVEAPKPAPAPAPAPKAAPKPAAAPKAAPAKPVKKES